MKSVNYLKMMDRLRVTFSPYYVEVLESADRTEITFTTINAYTVKLINKRRLNVYFKNDFIMCFWIDSYKTQKELREEIYRFLKNFESKLVEQETAEEPTEDTAEETTEETTEQPTEEVAEQEQPTEELAEQATCINTICDNNKESEDKTMTNEIELRETASNLYDGGWRASDREYLKAEYDFSEYELDIICEALLDFEV